MIEDLAEASTVEGVSLVEGNEVTEVVKEFLCEVELELAALLLSLNATVVLSRTIMSETTKQYSSSYTIQYQITERSFHREVSLRSTDQFQIRTLK